MKNKKVNFPQLKFHKRAMMGEGLLMIYRLILISFIALIILGLSAVFYDYYLDVRDAEARIVAKEVVNCMAPEGVVDLSKFVDVEKKNNLLEFCGFDKSELNRFYIDAEIMVGGDVVKKIEQGDSGSAWVYELFLKDIKQGTEKTAKIAKYKPGHFFNQDLKVSVLESGSEEKKSGNIKLEVFVNHEF
tara:strand:- start:237 stop:800 length:564 start_codon:yes stop_codon:yes gene_type:complete